MTPATSSGPGSPFVPAGRYVFAPAVHAATVLQGDLLRPRGVLGPHHLSAWRGASGPCGKSTGAGRLTKTGPGCAILLLGLRQRSGNHERQYRPQGHRYADRAQDRGLRKREAAERGERGGPAHGEREQSALPLLRVRHRPVEEQCVIEADPYDEQ